MEKAGGRVPLQHPPPARLHAVRGVQAPPLLGPRSRKPFPQIKIYHYTLGYMRSDVYVTAGCPVNRQQQRRLVCC